MINFFESEYLNGKKNGKWKEYKDKKLKFKREYLNNESNGKWNEYLNEKLEFEGEYLNGKRNGKGKNIIRIMVNLNLKVNT